MPGAREDEILPIRYDDNYVTIYAGETRVLEAEIDASLIEGIEPVIEIEGYNWRARTEAGRVRGARRPADHPGALSPHNGWAV